MFSFYITCISCGQQTTTSHFPIFDWEIRGINGDLNHLHSASVSIIFGTSIQTIISGFIEKSTYDGLETHYTVLKEMLKLLCDGKAESKRETVVESESSSSIISNLLPNKLLNRYAKIDISFVSSKIIRFGKHKWMLARTALSIWIIVKKN